MKANELRIGNYIFIPKDFPDWVPVEINLHFLELFINGKIKVSDLEPIPLTDDWLIRFGFIKLAKYWIEEDDELTVFELGNLSFIGKDGLYIPKPFYFSDAFTDDYKLEYVHQLQNLYFALTGEELNTTQ